MNWPAYGIGFMVVVALYSIALMSWRVFRDAVACNAEQRLYGVRDRIFERVSSGELSFQDPMTKAIVVHLHRAIHMTRSRRLRRQFIQKIFKCPASERLTPEKARELYPFIFDPRFEEASLSMVWHINKCMVTELFSRHWLIVSFVTVCMIAARLSRSIAGVFTQVMTSELPQILPAIQ